MKKIIVIITLLLISYNSYSQEIIYKKFDSKELGSSRDIKIFLPNGYKTDSVSNYPLAIVIDSDYLFDTYVANAKLFAMTDKAPKQIVVGISIDKTRKKDTYFDKNTLQLTDTNIRFLNFIKDEILPYMEGSYKTSPFVSLVGHGASVNIITAFLKNKSPIFNAFVAINPSFTPNITDKVKAYQIGKLSKVDNTFYYYTNEVSFFNKKKKIILTHLNNYLSSINSDNFNFKLDKMTSPNYISSMSEAIPRAISEVFQLYSAISKEEFNRKIKGLEPLDAISYLENKYLDIDFLFGSNLGIREKDIYMIEDIIIDKEDGEYLRNFGEMILNVYPRSHIGDYYVGLHFEKRKKFDLALESYKNGYGKMSDSDPNKDLFYINIQRLGEK